MFGLIEIVGVASPAVCIVLESIVPQAQTYMRYRPDDRQRNNHPRRRGSWQRRKHDDRC